MVALFPIIIHEFPHFSQRCSPPHPTTHSAPSHLIAKNDDNIRRKPMVVESKNRALSSSTIFNAPFNSSFFIASLIQAWKLSSYEFKHFTSPGNYPLCYFSLAVTLLLMCLQVMVLQRILEMELLKAPFGFV